MTALITTAESLKALTIVRSLGRKGISVTTGSASPFSLASSSMYALQHISYPPPLKDPRGFIHTVHRFLTENQHDVLLPVHSDDTLLLGRYSSLFSEVTHFPG